MSIPAQLGALLEVSDVERPTAAASAVVELQLALGGKVAVDTPVRAARSHDRSHLPSGLPAAVVRPSSTEDVATAVRICAAHGVAVVPIGAGTGLEGGANARAGVVTIDLSGMTGILRLSPADLDVTVQAGVMKSALNAELDPHGLFFPVGPGVDASVGGMCSTRASGTTAVRYGTMRESVLGLTVVLASGDIVRTGGRARKSAAGYDLTHLFVGAEGTLGIITEVTLRVYGQPQAVSAAVCGFPSLEAASLVVQEAIQKGIPLARVELMDDTTIAAVNAYSALEVSGTASLLFEFHGTPRAVEEQTGQIQAIAVRHGGSGFEFATEETDRQRLWQARHDVLPACQALVDGAHTWSTDVCVPISRLAECIAATKQDIVASGLVAPIAGHAGDGNFHLAIVLKPGDKDALVAASALNQRLVARALSMGGTCTGEHGIGAGKMDSLRAEHPAGVGVMAAIKAALDPHSLMNPGKVLAPAGTSRRVSQTLSGRSSHPAPRPEIAALPSYSRASGLGSVTWVASSNESSVPPSSAVQNAMAAATVGLNRYPSLFGDELVAAIARRLGLGDGQVLVGAGSLTLLQQLLTAYSGPGAEVVHAWRSYEAYPILVTVAGAASTRVALDAGLRHRLDAMADAITERTKVVIVCNPNNPTGTVIQHDELLRFLRRVPANVVVVLDEAYREFTQPEEDEVALLATFPNLVVLRTFSKAYGLAGARVGYLAAAPEIVGNLRRSAPPFGLSRVAEAGAVAAWAEDEVLRDTVAGVVAGREFLAEELRNRGFRVPESGGNFVWIPVEQARELEQACVRHGVSVRAFDGEGVRVTIGGREASQAVLAAVDSWLRC
ncbi:histidinol-phosphate transaminase [Arthrobacter sp. AZCC_0090]|uniref:histidinol-phosphate transaminase n=1 Tax=Arthrobacter sp. AZCC_0090 TaxID=2735881 RepID=UPI00161A5CE1|nr:histidinol-phosphate transaminase [Arthrobacter sp. AZCC_0090]MBB6407022.1 glycolate oxidase subunit GlcD/histidinol-phosphate aminotransferase [Arthrobacter sp. AZCC_0090]